MLLIWMIAGTQKEIVPVIFCVQVSVTVRSMLQQVSVFWSLTDLTNPQRNKHVCVSVWTYVYIYMHRHMKDWSSFMWILFKVTVMLFYLIYSRLSFIYNPVDVFFNLEGFSYSCQNMNLKKISWCNFFCCPCTFFPTLSNDY